MANTDGDITLTVILTPEDIRKTAWDIQADLEEIFNSNIGSATTERFKQLQISAARLYDSIENVADKMLFLEKLPGGTDTDEYSKVTQELNNLTNQATLVRNRLQELNTEPPSDTITWAYRLGQALAVPAKAALVLHERLMNAISRGIKQKIIDLGKSISGLGKHLTGTNNALEMGFKKFIRYGLGVRSIFALINKLRRALIEGIGNLAQYSPAFNSVISQFISSLETLKNAFATAFAPVLSVVLPILTTLANALIEVITLIAQFFAALTGASTFIRAKKVNKDYAASLDKTGKSGSNASKGIGKAKDSAEELQRTIAGFDDVEILKENDDSDSSSGSGGGGGSAGGVGDLLPSDMFETAEIESPISNLANKLRELIAQQDWGGLGQFLGKTINSVFEQAKEFISWDNLGNKITFVINAIATTFNSLITAIDWQLIGSTFGEGVNTIINTLTLLITKIDWGNFGHKLMVGLNSFIGTVDWIGLGELFAQGINAIFNFLYNVLATFDWKNAASSLSKSLNSFVNTVDWNKLGQTFSELVIGVLEFLTTAITEFNWGDFGLSVLEALLSIDWLGILSNVVKSIISLWGSLEGLFYSVLFTTLTHMADFISDQANYLFSASGEDIINGILSGMLSIITSIATWVLDNILKPFLTAFDNAFEIGSPSKVMETRGNFIIEGLLNGITNTWNAITQFFTDSVGALLQLFNPESWVQTGSELVGKLKSGCSNAWDGLKKLFSKETGNTKNTVTKENWNEAGSSVVTTLKSGIASNWDSTLGHYITTGITNVKNSISRFTWEGAGNAIVTKLRNGISAMWATLTSYITVSITNLKNSISNADWVSAGKAIPTKLKNGISDAWWNVTSFISSGINSIKNKFYETDWASLGKNICSGIEDGINRGWSWVTNAAKDLADSALNAAKDKLDINSPSKVFRDVIGRAIPEGLAAGIEKESDLAIRAVNNLTTSVANADIPQLEIPSVALGKIIPYETTKNIDTLNNTVKSLLDVLQSTKSNAVTREDLITILNTVLPTMLQNYVSFYIGDEQIARHANAGNSLLDYRFNPVGN